ncbi:MAG TPA: hypothetical protein VGS00_10815 [Thermoanaerobaculia bacterium]|nr:hypothetical protein [Thermoanaerobaculia bacterium]
MGATKKAKRSRRIAVALFDHEAELFDKFGGVISSSGTAAMLIEIGLRFCEAAGYTGATLHDTQLRAWRVGSPFGPEAILKGSPWGKDAGNDMIESLREAAGILSRVTRVEELRRGERVITSIVARARLRAVPPPDKEGGTDAR